MCIRDRLWNRSSATLLCGRTQCPASVLAARISARRRGERCARTASRPGFDRAGCRSSSLAEVGLGSVAAVSPRVLGWPIDRDASVRRMATQSLIWTAPTSQSHGPLLVRPRGAGYSHYLSHYSSALFAPTQAGPKYVLSCHRKESHLDPTRD